ncbi:hypothetical protein ACFL2P_04040 [Candidatus Moduliflexota bacterium]
MVLHTYDIAVLGDYPGGLAAAAQSAKRGKRVLLFEESEVAGDDRPMEYLNAICGGPEKEAGLGRFFHDLGLSPFGPLGDDRIHFLPLHPPLQIILPRNRVNIYQDRVARNWEMEREFGTVERSLDAIQKREESFREKLFRYRSRRPEKERTALRRTAGDLSRLYRFWAVRKEAERETFFSFLSTLSPPPGFADVLVGQAQGVFRILPRSLPWTVGLRAIQVLQGGLFQNAAGQSGLLNGLKEAFRRLGGECRPLHSLESVEGGKGDLMQLGFSAGRNVQAEHLVIDLPLEKAIPFFQPEMVKSLRKRGLDQADEEWHYGLMRLSVRKEWLPECMGGYLVLDPDHSGKRDATILLALQPGAPAGDDGMLEMEVLGLFRTRSDLEARREVIWRRLGDIIPFLDRTVAGEVSFMTGSFPCYLQHQHSWRSLEDYYRSGRRTHSFKMRQMTFLRNEEYIGTGLSDGLLAGIWAVD